MYSLVNAYQYEQPIHPKTRQVKVCTICAATFVQGSARQRWRFWDLTKKREQQCNRWLLQCILMYFAILVGNRWKRDVR
jgi:hypothetical protein